MRKAIVAVLVLAVPLVTGCVSRSVTCGPAEYQLSPANVEAGNWRFVRVDADGVVVLERGGQPVRVHPSAEAGWGPTVLEANAARQSATIRMPSCTYRWHFLWWSWVVGDPDQEQAVFFGQSNPAGG